MLKTNKKNKNLIIYFPVYGSARKIAKEIGRQTKGDVKEIEPVIPYDSDRSHYNALARLAKKEHDEERRPQIKNEIDISGYDNIFIGYPMWWYTFPMIIYTLFDRYDFSDKNIIPFNTHMGSGDGGTYQTIKELEPNANVLEGLPLEMKEAQGNISETVNKWLKTLNITGGTDNELC